MRHPRSLSGVLVLLAALTASPVAAQSAPPSASPPTGAVPLCSTVPDIVIPDDRFGDRPVYVGNEQPTDQLRRWARQQPGFEDLWIDRDHLGWVVLAFSQDADSRQDDLERDFPGVGVIAIEVDWTTEELESLQQRAQTLDVQGSSTDILKGVVGVMVGLLTPETIARMGEAFAGERVCLDGIDPATVPSPGPQPLAGDGWRLLGEDRVGEPYRTGIAADQPSYRALWRQARLSGRPPAVDFEQEVAIWFGAVYGGSCPAIRMDDVVFDSAASLVHPVIVQTEPVMACTDDANGHAYLVAVDRARLPAPPFRIQLQADDPPQAATRETTRVTADLREPGSIPGPGQVQAVRPSQELPARTSGDVVEPGFGTPYLLDARCGVEWLGILNGIWWRTDVPAGETAFVPDAWRPLLDADGSLTLTVLLRQGDDPAVTDGEPRAEANAADHTVIYHATMEPPPACP